jgi:2-keto-4-pentenoate hydratase/2-oxohepta-3-ene-1,7-dioic acid hydratase in catechol pathway
MYLAEDFEFRKIFGMVLNYADHITEMNSEAPSHPIFFLVPPTAIIRDGETIILPAGSREVHYEVELAVLIGRGGKKIPLRSAYDHVAGYGIGIDVTLRDFQKVAKKMGYPWALAKGFDTSAPLSRFVPRELIDNIYHEEFTLTVNGEMKQHNSPATMIFRIDEIIEFISRYFTLNTGDVIFTGTPMGIGELQDGDSVKATLGNLVSLTCSVKKEI